MIFHRFDPKCGKMMDYMVSVSSQVAETVDISLDADRYPHLTNPFLVRFQKLLADLDPVGLWWATYSALALQCLTSINHFYGHLQEYMDEEHQSLVTDALFLAFRAHKLTLRKSKDALFFEHPVATADYLATFCLDAATLAAALLHDVAEDTMVSISQIVEQFGPEVGMLVEGVTRLRATGREVVSQIQQDEIGIESFNKLFRFMIDDVRVVLVKLADRRHNMQTLSALSEEKQHEKAHEVLQVYAPLAYRMGMWDVKSELEELALKALHPDLYTQLKTLMEKRARQQDRWMEIIRKTLRDHLAAAGLEVCIEPSPEQAYSLYREHERDGRPLVRLPDLIRIAIVVERQRECYQALGEVHRLWKPVPGTFDDYIAHPRENLYRSLHTTVFGPGGLLKIRFRTREMHQIAHHGILTRWRGDISNQAERLDAPIQRLLERLKPVDAIEERGARLEAYREALTDQIQVFTPEIEMVELPAGSTPLDFAYQIHSKIGDEARSARINGELRPLNTTLRNGDQVSIIRIDGELPLREWLDEDLEFVRTVYARNRIRRIFRRLDGDEAVTIGRQALQREMELMGLDEGSYDMEEIAGQLQCESVDDLLLAIARADVMPSRVARIAFAPVWRRIEATPIGGVILSPDGPITVRGVLGRPIKLCGACEPVPGDSIVGDLLRGGQVTVHRMDCRNIAPTTERLNRLNLVEVSWAKELRKARPIHIIAAAVDRAGLAHSITRVVQMEEINICEMYARTDHQRHVASFTITVDVTSLRQLSRILHRLAQLPNVKAIRRVCDPPHAQEWAMQWALDQVERAS
jgi:GTP pyrophosphokinase